MSKSGPGAENINIEKPSESQTIDAYYKIVFSFYDNDLPQDSSAQQDESIPYDNTPIRKNNGFSDEEANNYEFKQEEIIPIKYNISKEHANNYWLPLMVFLYGVHDMSENTEGDKKNDTPQDTSTNNTDNKKEDGKNDSKVSNTPVQKNGTNNNTEKKTSGFSDIIKNIEESYKFFVDKEGSKKKVHLYGTTGNQVPGSIKNERRDRRDEAKAHDKKVVDVIIQLYDAINKQIEAKIKPIKQKENTGDIYLSVKAPIHLHCFVNQIISLLGKIPGHSVKWNVQLYKLLDKKILEFELRRNKLNDRSTRGDLFVKSFFYLKETPDKLCSTLEDEDRGLKQKYTVHDAAEICKQLRGVL